LLSDCPVALRSMQLFGFHTCRAHLLGAILAGLTLDVGGMWLLAHTGPSTFSPLVEVERERIRVLAVTPTLSESDALFKEIGALIDAPHPPGLDRISAAFAFDDSTRKRFQYPAAPATTARNPMTIISAKSELAVTRIRNQRSRPEYATTRLQGQWPVPAS
jgi:hypothetical protein